MNKKELVDLISKYKPKYLYRRKDGCIDKFEVIDKNTVIDIQTGIVTKLDETILLGKISENIIDLIECGDYVNGYLVKDIDYAFDDVALNKKNARIVPYIDCNKNNYIDDIKSILTKEQFNQMKYIVGGE